MFKVWKTITIKDKPNLEGINISSYAQDILNKIKWPVKEQKIDLVKIKVSDLGFTKWVTLKDLFAKAKELGLDLCPPQVGPQLREEYTDQPLNEWIYIGMKSIADRDGNPSVFFLAHVGDGLWLDDDWAEPGSGWDPSREFVFRLRKSLKLKPLDLSFDPSVAIDSLELRIKALEDQIKKLREVIKF